MSPQNSNLIVLTGGPGTGKTTLIKTLEQRGYHISPEVARAVIAGQQERNGTALPWVDNAAYANVMLRGSIRAWQEGLAQDPQPVFFDRGLPDTLAHRRLSGLPEEGSVSQAIATYRYRKTAFILPPWADIYTPDDARTQSFSEAVRTYVVLCKTYIECGYELVELRKDTPERRADLVLNHLRL
ncbi:AAA family ATPase [Thalassospira mesophila]|uniref:ATPase n=1 Tax=Thalassospira mesophila TaxID=1293891 RepID=A0A1Y2KXC5_9PROT|nr:AAA family ATPase [Thalassospira mesophila]OSQ35845.1 ATPase [Thalassospira mesophila]